MEQLIKNIEQWFIDRGLDKADPNKQLLKFIEEAGELASGLARDDKDLIADSIGDMVVVLIGLAKQVGVTRPLEIPRAPFYHSSVEGEISYILFSVWEIAKGYKRKEGYRVDEMVQDTFNDLVRLSDNIAEKFELDSPGYFKGCVQIAYDKIKHRKGQMINGIFVKEEDLT